MNVYTARVDKRYYRNGVPFYVHVVRRDGEEVAKWTSGTRYFFAVYGRDYRWKFTNTWTHDAVPIVLSF